MLKNQADFFLTLDDDDAATGMRTLAYPYPGDPVLESGESGASAIGAVIQILRQYPEAKDVLGLGQNSVVLCISTEGATDRENYQRIVREGGECLDADRGQF
jgi:diaminopropionate ammonia-lyase